MPDKPFKIPAADIKPLAEGLGGCFATDAITVGGRKVTIPSYRVSKGHMIAIKEKSRSNEQIKASVETARARGVPNWLDLSPETFSGTVLELPSREDIKLPISEQLIVELYSK